MKSLVVAEKPSVARDIARVLGCSEQRNGCRVGNSYVVTWAVGHLVGNCDPDEVDPKYREWKKEDLPIMPDPIPLKVYPDTEKQYEIVSDLMNSSEVSEIICATDAGREGELIFRYIYQMAGCRKPVKRLWISSMTPQAIREGFGKLRPGSDYDDLYRSALCRSDADWLIGMNASRAYSIQYDARLSVGRVQSPTLAMLVEREKERQGFIPETYGILTADMGSFQCSWYDPEKEGPDAGQISKEQIPLMRKMAEELAGKRGKVIAFEKEERSIPAPRLYDLTALQRDANRLLGFPAKKTLQITQDLYEKRKAVTYPRTDSRYLSHDMEKTLKKRLDVLEDGSLGPFVRQAQCSEKKLFGRFINDAGVSDHHAIIPTGYVGIGADWTDGEKKIFDLIARRFIAMFLPNTELEEQRMVITIEGHHFRARGERLLQTGWCDVAAEKPYGQTVLPETPPGTEVRVKNARLEEKETQPPAPYTDASLLYAMEHAGEKVAPQTDGEKGLQARSIGLGTPATRADTIEKLLNRGYAVRRGKAIFPTRDGIQLIGILPEEMTSAEMTVRWEKRLAAISEGKADSGEFISDIRLLTAKIVEEAEVSPGDGMRFGPAVLGRCPLCGGDVVDGKHGYYCRNRECPFATWKAQKGEHPYLRPEEMSALLQGKTIEVPKGVFSISKQPPYVCFERRDPTEEESSDKKMKLMAVLAEEGITPVDKTSAGGALWIPGGQERKPLLERIRKELKIQFYFKEDPKALGRRPGWWTNNKNGL